MKTKIDHLEYFGRFLNNYVDGASQREYHYLAIKPNKAKLKEWEAVRTTCENIQKEFERIKDRLSNK